MMPDVPPQPPATVNQPGWPPTNKLMIGVATTMLVNLALRLLEQNGLTAWLGADIGLFTEIVYWAVSSAIGALVGLAAGYFKKDKPNQVAEVAALERTVVNAGLPLPAKPQGNTP